MRTFFLTHIKNYKQQLDIICIGLILLFTLFDFSIFNTYIKDKELSFVFILSFWLLLKTLLHKTSIKKISVYDIGFLILFIYFNINFFVLSGTTFYYSRYAVFVGYFFVFYAFRWYLKNEDNNSVKLYRFLSIIVFFCIIQSILSLLQYTELISVKNPYFKLLGSFTSPNYLALYLSFGVIILLWYVFVIGVTHKLKTMLIAISLLLMGMVIILSDSRGTFLSLLFSGFILCITSKKKSQWLLKSVGAKKIIFFISIGTVLFFTFKHLYYSDVASINGRKFIAKITTQKIAENPLQGYGAFNFIGSYNKSKSDYFTEIDRPWEEVKVGNYVFNTLNDFLLVAYEFGLPFLFLMLLLIITILFKVKLNNRTRIGIALVVNIVVWSLFNSAIGNVSIMLVGIFGFCILMTSGNLNEQFLIRTKSISKIVIVCLLFFSFLGIYGAYKKYSASVALEEFSKNSFNKSRFIKLSEMLENNGGSDFKIGMNLYRNGYQKEGYTFMEKSFKKAYHPKAGKSLASLYIKDGNFKRAEEIYRINEGLEPFRYEHKMLLIALMEKTKNYKELVRLSQIVVDFPVKIQSKTINKYKEKALKNIALYSQKRIESPENQ